MEQKYAKLLANLGNSLDAACGKAARETDLMRAVRREGKACFEAAGIVALDAKAYGARVREVRMDPVDGFAHQGSSSWQSLARGTGSIEADYLNGEVVLLGRLHDVPTPVNAMLNDLANEMVRTARAPGSFTIEELETRLG